MVKLWPLICLKSFFIKTKIYDFFWGLKKGTFSLLSGKKYFYERQVPTWLKFLMQNICLKFFSSLTMIFDFPQPSTRKKEKFQIFLGLRKRKLHLCSWKYYFKWHKYMLETFNRKNVFGNNYRKYFMVLQISVL